MKQLFTLIGPPELRFTSGGHSVCRMYAEPEDAPVRLTAWGDLGEEIADHVDALPAGKEIGVAGKYSEREFKGTTYHEFVITQLIYMCDGRAVKLG